MRYLMIFVPLLCAGSAQAVVIGSQHQELITMRDFVKSESYQNIREASERISFACAGLAQLTQTCNAEKLHGLIWILRDLDALVENTFYLSSIQISRDYKMPPVNLLSARARLQGVITGLQNSDCLDSKALDNMLSSLRDIKELLTD